MKLIIGNKIFARKNTTQFIITIEEITARAIIGQYQAKCDDEDLWRSYSSGTFGFSSYELSDYVPPKPVELWLQDIGNGLWQEKFRGLGRHFREVEE